MLTSLPLISLILLGIFFASRRSDSNVLTLRPAFLKALIACGVLITISTECFSALHQISRPAILLLWILTPVMTLILIRKSSSRHPLVGIGVQPSLALAEIFFLLAITLIFILTGIVAFTAPPNNFDSMTYHLPRVMHWIQNRSVAFYATNCNRQLFNPPMAEYAVMHLQLLAGNDRFANGIQWMSMIGSVVGVSWIAYLFGASRLGQIIAAFFAATIPMGIVQASTTQNDYVVALWTVCTVAFFLQYRKQPLRQNALWIGLSFGLALLTKGSAWSVLLPFLVWAIVAGLRHGKELLKFFAVLFSCVLILNIPQAIRNYQFGGNPLTPHFEARRVFVNKMTPSFAVSNILRNLSLHLSTDSPQINQKIYNIIEKIHQRLHVSISDPRITYIDNFGMLPRNFHEDTTGNRSHLLLILLVIPFIFIRCRKPPSIFSAYVLCMVVGCLLFCLTVKWQPWHSRMHLLFFLFLAPLIGNLVSPVSPHKKGLVLVQIIVIGAAVCILLIDALPALFFNHTRRMMDKNKNTIFTIQRSHQYFTLMPEWISPYEDATQYIKTSGCRDIGLIIDGEKWEYPLWVLLNFGRNMRIEHIFIDDPQTQKYAVNNFNPCLILTMGKTAPSFPFQGQTYIRTENFGLISLYQRDDAGTLTTENFNQHFQNTLLHLNKTNVTIDTPEKFRQFQRELSDEFYEAQLVDINLLNRVVPGLGDVYQNKLLVGLQKRLEGLMTVNQSKIREGENLLQEWNVVYSQAISIPTQEPLTHLLNGPIVQPPVPSFEKQKRPATSP